MAARTGHHLRHDPARRRAGPGLLDAHRREAPAGPAARRARRGHHRGRLPDRLGGRRRSACGRSRREVRRPVIAALARCRPKDIDAAGEALAPAERSRIHTFIATSDLHLEQQAAHHARAVPRGGGRRRSSARAATPTTCSSRPRTRRAATSTSCAASSRRSSTPGRTTINLPDTVGYCHAGRDRASSSRTVARPGPERGPGDLQRALPQRPRTRGRQHAGGGPGRGAPGRVHDQRHRRARRQRVARGDRDGACACVPTGCRSPPASTPSGSTPRASCCSSSPARRSRPTRPSSGATRSRTRPASTRTAC